MNGSSCGGFGSKPEWPNRRSLQLWPHLIHPLSNRRHGATQRLPADGDLDPHSQQQLTKYIADVSRSHHEELAAMLLELQTNRLILGGLTRWYGLFVFTGGHVPTAQWNLAAMTSYHKHSLATDSVPLHRSLAFRRCREKFGADFCFLAQPLLKVEQPDGGVHYARPDGPILIAGRVLQGRSRSRGTQKAVK